MLFRGIVALMILTAGALASARLVLGVQPMPAISGERSSPAMAPTMSKAPLSLGHPAAAAGLKTRLPGLPVEEKPVFAPYDQLVRVGPGDTLSGLLAEAGIGGGEAQKAIKALKKHYNPSRIRQGEVIRLTFKPQSATEMPGRFLGLAIDPEFKRRITVARTEDGGFHASEVERDLTLTLARAGGVISRSLFADGEKAGIPVPVLAEMIRAYSWDVDFQRDIRPGDGFEVMFERHFGEDGKLVYNGRILYAQLTLSGKRNPIYHHTLKDGSTDYFDDRGQSAKKALMRTPIDGARLSSGFGKRRHPILGYMKQHRGVDFAAPPGTPIYAAGDGMVEVAGRNGAYGKYVRIRHNSEYSTAYAHMKRINTRKGRRVKQGQVIGYVGTTGRSTGPHLHYEILRKGRRTNPMRVKMPSGRKLKGQELARFMDVRATIEKDYAELAETVTAAK